jgi:hypothetical protein
MNPLRSACLISLVGLLPAAIAQNNPTHVGRVADWSSHHLVASGGPSNANLKAAESEPRILFSLAERNLMRTQNGGLAFYSASELSERPSRSFYSNVDARGTTIGSVMHRDWSVSLGNGGLSQAKYPAKYTFDINGTPSCTADFAVFALNVAGVTSGQANIVGINKLYSGTGPNGLCGTTPAVTWAYNGGTAGGSVFTSPTISLDGTKIAYVESAAGKSVFHVLTVNAGQGTVTKSVAPTANGTCTGGATPSSCLVSTTYSSTVTTTLADPWVDYQTDKAFVASDDGKISRISCVFNCVLNTQPTIDWTFTLPVAGTGGAQPVPNSPVYDYPSGRLFVADQLGEVWVLNAGGSTPSVNAGPVMVGGGGCTVAHPPGRTGTGTDCTGTGTGYGIPDAIMMDASGVSQKIFAISGNSGSGAVMTQFSMNLTQRVNLALGQGGVNLYAGAFNNGYWGTTPQTSGDLFVCGTGATDSTPWIYWVGFSSYPTMDSTFAGNVTRSSPAGSPCVPFTEFYNPNLNLGGVAGDHDELMGGVVAAGTSGLMITDDISKLPLLAGLNDVNYPGGVGGVIVDGVSTSNQASSMYFGTLTAHTAVKLTQLNSK